jgi:hypothetical protein
MLQPPGKRDEFLPAPVRELRRLVDEGLLPVFHGRSTTQPGEERGAN